MTRQSLPQAFIDKLQNVLPATVFNEAVETFLQTPAWCSFRVNTLKITAEQLLNQLTQFSLSPVAWYDAAFLLPIAQRRALTETIEFQQGQIYIQNLSSMLPIRVLDPQPEENILDLAAAPGSKTGQAAMCMRNTGRIAAVELVKSRFFRLKSNLQQQGITNTQCYLKDGAQVWRYCREHFDRILLDAPCSSEARFNVHDPDSFRYWSEKKSLEMSRKQKRLLWSAIHCLKPGGVVVYATCAFAPEENELVINHLLKKYPDALSIEPFTLPIANTQAGLISWKGKSLHPGLINAQRILPTEAMQGFFICKIRKQARILL